MTHSVIVLDMIGALAAAGLGSAAQPEVVGRLIATPPRPELGDVSVRCFDVARAAEAPLNDVAATAAEALKRAPGVADAKRVGGYVNVVLNIGTIAPRVLAPFLCWPVGALPATGRRVMVEFSQPNTHKAFHVGHFRNVCIGDALVRILRSMGHEVISANYLGDVGAHVAKALWGYLDLLDDPGRSPPDEGRGAWLGGIYARASQELSDLGARAEAGDATAAEALGRARARIGAILAGLEARDPDITPIWVRTREWSLDEFDEIYAWSDVTFDHVFYESDVDRAGLELVEEFLAKGVFVHSDGAVGIFHESMEHMPFFMLRKRDGTSLYSTKDLALARVKFETFGVDESIYVVDARQSDHFRHVFLTLERMGLPQAGACRHVAYEMVELTDGPMATRAGRVVLFRDLRDAMTAEVRERYLKVHEGTWSAVELVETARSIALGALRYGMLNRDLHQRIVFDMMSWLDLEGDSGPYLQYSCTRARSILQRCADKGSALAAALVQGSAPPLAPDEIEAALATIEDLPGRRLIVALDGLRDAVIGAGESARPERLCRYLYGLARAYNAYNQAVHVLSARGPEQQGRLLLTAAYLRAASWGLGLLGIPTPPRM
jgi:arginyl-tRNA synthetase